VIEVTHQANSYRIFIGPVSARASAMSADGLISPAKCNLNLAITAIGSVTYDKIVANPLPVLAFSVKFVKYSCISVWCVGMM